MALASIIGGLSAGVGNFLGADAQAKEARRNRKFQERVYSEGVERAAPWVGAGENALAQYMTSFGTPGGGNALASFYQSPEYLATYQSALDNANRVIDRQASAGGGLNSGRRIMAAQDRAADISSRGINNYLARLFGTSEAGRAAATGVNAFTGNQAGRIADASSNVGAANAAGYMGIGNSINNTLFDITQQAAQRGGQSTSGYDFTRLF